MDPKMFDGIQWIFLGLLVMFPLGIWKAVEIVIWLVTHVRISW